ncbi:MAG: S41 family peptidase [Candidatus Limivicinus sp.]
MKKTLSILLILAMALSLSAAAFAEGSSTEKTVPVYRESMTGDETVTLRMVGDIPYIKIDDYYNKLLFTGAEKYPQQASPMKVTRSGSVYETTAYDGTKGIFNAEENTFTCENLDAYSTPPYYALLLASERDPSAPFVSISHTDYTGDRKTVNVDFGRYGIDILGEGDELWVPLAVLQGLFCSPFAYNVFYNGKNIYLSDGMEQLQTVNAKDMDEDYYAFGETERSEEKINFDYGSLCFYVDTCYGYPERSRLSASIAEVGLDQTLDRTIDGMDLPGVKKLLLSPDIKEYACGLYLLLMALDDGGHTAFADFFWVPKETLMTWLDAIAELGIKKTEKTDYADVSLEGLTAAFEKALQNGFDRVEVMSYDNGAEQATYLEQGDTAMFLFDHFYCNRAAWTAYEDGQMSEMPEDSMGTFMKALEMAKANPNIKNFVVNIAMNAGGESGIATTISKLICGQSYRHQLDVYTGRDEVIWYDVDLNFDGVFDEEDGEVSYPFRFAVIEGAQTYSAANYLTNMAKDNGVCVLGEMSGGGANSPQQTPESEGLWFQLSGRYKLMDKNNETVDLGIEPDYALTEEKDGEIDYSRFFDFAEISRLIDGFYGNQSAELPDAA